MEFPKVDLEKVDPSTYTITYLHGGKDKLGESPTWHPGMQKFFWSDVHGSKIFSLELPADGSVATDANITEYAVTNMVSGMAPKEGSGFVCVFKDHGFGTLDFNDDGTVKETLFGLKPEMTEENGVVFNDAKCSPDGRFFAG